MNFRDQKWARADWTEAPLISDRVAMCFVAISVAMLFVVVAEIIFQL